MELRQKLIKEVLDSDKMINKRLSYIQFKNVPKNEIALLHHQMDPEEVQKLGVFFPLLERRCKKKTTPQKCCYRQDPPRSTNTS